MFQFFSAEIDHRRRNPGSDLISLLVSGPPEDQLNTPELVMFCVLLLIAGNETTTNLIANQAQAFFDHPDQLAAATADRSLIAGSVEEALRYNGPVHGLFRQTRTAATIAGTEIPAGARILLQFAAANRDERHYPDPDTFDITRNTADHLAFGGGIHLCLGAPLARLEAAVAWDVLLDRCPQIQPSAPPTPVGGFILRGASHVPVTL
jgi:cytochrome P450